MREKTKKIRKQKVNQQALLKIYVNHLKYLFFMYI